MLFGRATSTSKDGFYEIFSDLIFGVMAIFVLLFIIMVSLLRPPPPENLPPEKIDLVIAIDVSGSMDKHINQLHTALRELARNFPNMIEDFRIGIVAYRKGFSAYPKVKHGAVFPLQPMTADALSALENFMDKFVVPKIPGPYRVDPVWGLERAIDELPDSNGDVIRKQILVIIGDAAAEYRASGRPKSTSSIDASRIVSSFIAQSPERRILAIFSGYGNKVAYNFFCSVAKTGGIQGRFSEDASKNLIWDLLSELWRGRRRSNDSQLTPDC